MNGMFTHNMGSQIIGELDYTTPFQWTFVYADNRRVVFNNIVHFTSMKTGCYVLVDSEGITYVIRPLHEYIIERPQPKTEEAR